MCLCMCMHMFACVEFAHESALHISENHYYKICRELASLLSHTNVRRDIKMSDKRPHSRLTFCQTSPRSFSATLPPPLQEIHQEMISYSRDVKLYPFFQQHYPTSPPPSLPETHTKCTFMMNSTAEEL